MILKTKFIKGASEEFLGHVMRFQGQMKANTMKWPSSSLSVFPVSSVFLYSKV